MHVQMATRRDASLCILTGEERRVPQGLQQSCRVESEEWLLLAAEAYLLPPTEANATAPRAA